jgi:hypothetical protein
MERDRSLTVHRLRAVRSMMGQVLERLRPDARASSPDAHATDQAVSARLKMLEAQLRHVEAALEGLQDAVHRRSLLDDERNDELQRRTHPAQIARDLSDDARNRGL